MTWSKERDVPIRLPSSREEVLAGNLCEAGVWRDIANRKSSSDAVSDFFARYVNRRIVATRLILLTIVVTLVACWATLPVVVTMIGQFFLADAVANLAGSVDDEARMTFLQYAEDAGGSSAEMYLLILDRLAQATQVVLPVVVFLLGVPTLVKVFRDWRSGRLREAWQAYQSLRPPAPAVAYHLQAKWLEDTLHRDLALRSGRRGRRRRSHQRARWVALTFGVGFALAFLVSVIAMTPVLVGGEEVAQALNNPIGLLGALVGVAVLLPVAGWATWRVWRVPPDWFLSIAGCIRWRWLLRSSLVAAGLVMATLLVTGSATPVAPALWGLLPVILLVTPLQAAAEEVVFRGVLLQSVAPRLGAIGAGILTSTVFALLHFGSNPSMAAYVTYFGMGLAFAYMAITTGGLEAPIAMHVANNTVVLAVASITGVGVTAGVETSGFTWTSAGIQLVLTGLFVAYVHLYGREFLRVKDCEEDTVGTAAAGGDDA